MNQKEFKELLNSHILDYYQIKDNNFRKQIVEYYSDSLHIYCSIVKAFQKEKNKNERDNIKKDLQKFEETVIGPKVLNWDNK
jgi:hypothetical protein